MNSAGGTWTTRTVAWDSSISIRNAKDLAGRLDPHRHIDRAKARMVMNLSANDYFFWLGDAVEDYQRLAVEKRLCISPNFNHNDGAFRPEEELAV